MISNKCLSGCHPYAEGWSCQQLWVCYVICSRVPSLFEWWAHQPIEIKHTTTSLHVPIHLKRQRSVTLTNKKVSHFLFSITASLNSNLNHSNIWCELFAHFIQKKLFYNTEMACLICVRLSLTCLLGVTLYLGMYYYTSLGNLSVA